jgi:hypothetical protein
VCGENSWQVKVEKMKNTLCEELPVFVTTLVESVDMVTAVVNANSNTGKHNFCHIKTSLYTLCIFHAEFKYVIRIALLPTVFV